MDPQDLVDQLIAYWSQGPGAVGEEGRRICREVAAVLARSMSGLELLALQEAPEEHRREIEMRVGVYLAMAGSPPREEAPVKRNLSSAPAPVPPPAPMPVRSKPEPPVGSGLPAGGISQQVTGGGFAFGNVGSIGSVGNLGTIHQGPTEERPAAVAPPAEVSKTRILFLGANPSDSTPLHLDEEVRAIDRAITMAHLGSRCELCQKWAVRVADLQGYLLAVKPQVLHFSGHGSADRSILLQGDDGASRPVAAERLARLLARFNQRLRCVVLNACYTKAHGEALAEHIDCVVGMSTAVGDPAAIRFSTAFYLAVASGCSVEDAFEQARADIELGEMGEDEIPTLLARRCDPGEVFLVRGGGPEES